MPKLPPLYSEAANQAEQAVLGRLMLLDEQSVLTVKKVLSKLRSEDFYSYHHKLIYQSIGHLVEKGITPDMVEVSDELTRLGHDEQTGGIAYLADLCKAVASNLNLMAYVRLVQKDSLRRQIHILAHQIDDDVDEQEDLSQFLAQVAIEVHELQRQNQPATTYRHISEFIEEWQQQHDTRFNELEDTFLKTGIDKLDAILAPVNIPLGSLVVVASRPKMGKTSFLIKLAENATFLTNKSVLSFSLEMTGSQLVERILVSKADVSSDVLYQTKSELDEAEQSQRKGVRTLYEHNMRLVKKAIEQYRNTAYYLDDSPALTIEQIEIQARTLQEALLKQGGQPIGMIMVDYLTLMKKGNAERNDLALADITRRLKLLAKELNCVVVLVSQLNRGLEQRQDKRPLPSDSRDTGQIEQDCDLWIGLYRESFYRQDNQDHSVPEGLLEVIVRLNRHGGTGTAYCLIESGKIKPYQGEPPQPLMKEFVKKTHIERSESHEYKKRRE